MAMTPRASPVSQAQYQEPDADDAGAHGSGTAEYEENGPYHCADCSFVDAGGDTGGMGEGYGTCSEPHIVADVQSGAHPNGGNAEGLGIVALEPGCCRFVDATKSDEQTGQEDEIPSGDNGESQAMRPSEGPGAY